MKRNSFVAVILSLVMVFTMMPMIEDFAYADSAGLTVYSDLNLISKHGNVYLTSGGKKVLPQDFADAGIEYGDIVTVSFLNKTIDMPVVRNFNEVPAEEHLIRMQDDKTEIAINYEDFATVYIADKTTYESGSIAWAYKEGIDGPVAFNIVLKEKGGWIEKPGQVGLSYTNDRNDYPDLSDEEFANFRMITTTGVRKGILYRTCSPVNPMHKRNTYADAALKKNGVKTIMNLADSKADVEGYEGYSESYYSTCNYIALNMGMSFMNDEFRTKLASGLRFFADHAGPYAVHCTEGKDRCGLISAILECFMGASYDEVKRDYMVTFYNYYGISPTDEEYDKIADTNIKVILQKLFNVEKIEQADLSREAKDYFKEIGLTDTEIEKLRTNLSNAQPKPEKESVKTPKKARITRLFSAKKALTVKWKKVSGVTGYQIQYGVKRSLKGAKKVTIPKAGATSKKIKKLKAKKKYYVRIRTYKKVNGRSYYSAWSAKKSKRTK